MSSDQVRTWHDAIGHYLDAELCHSAGAYDAALRGLARAGKAAPSTASATPGHLSHSFDQILQVAVPLNRNLRNTAHSVGADQRHPASTGDVLSFLDPDCFDRVHDFYTSARHAISAKECDRDQSMKRIHTAILGTGDEKSAEQMARRYDYRRQFAARALATRDRGQSAGPTACEGFTIAGLHDGGRLPAFVLTAFFQAHINRYNVEHDRSVAVGDLLSRTVGELGQDRERLQQSVALLTYSFAICLAFPWLFSRDFEQRDEIAGRFDDADRVRELRDEIALLTPVWIGRQLLLLSIYRRADAFRLLGQHERSYNDLRKVQRLARQTKRQMKDNNDAGRATLNALETLAEYKIGELYRADHDASQALRHICRSWDLVRARGNKAGVVSDSALFQVQIKLGKGKAFMEVGAVKRALKWFVRAWFSLRDLTRSKPQKPPAVKALDEYLESVKHAPEINKEKLRRLVEGAVPVIGTPLEPKSTKHAALEADVLIRIAHVLLVLRLEGTDPPNYGAGLFRRAADLDPHNLLAWSGLLRCELRGTRPWGSGPADPMKCWPSGASDVDQAIRAGEYIMLERVRDAEREAEEHAEREAKAATQRDDAQDDADPADDAHDPTTDDRHTQVARALLNHFHTHTDSINLRLGILHRYLMQRRADEMERLDALFEGVALKEPALEFVCLRRYGSFHPLMPRPEAVAAVGGGYLVRVLVPHKGMPDDQPARAFNVLIDPGDGVIKNLYRVGLAISDVDMIIVTHDHPDHLAALDAILSLRYERRGRGRRTTVPSRDSPQPAAGGYFDPDADLIPVDDTQERMLILGNASVVNRYSFLNGYRDCVVLHIDDASAQRCPQLTSRRIGITSLRTSHLDLGKHNAVGFVLTLKPKQDATGLRITFMSDTRLRGLYEQGDAETESLRARWKEALKSDVIVAHVSDSPSGELRGLAFPHDSRRTSFDDQVLELLKHREDDGVELIHALSLSNPERTGTSPLLSPAFLTTMADWDHLYLRGLLAVSRAIEANKDGKKRVLVVGELREQLGSFRGTIAREINRHMFGREQDETESEQLQPDVRPMALTSDIGLRIRLSESAGQRVRCSTCAQNNDRIDVERYHRPEDIHEVCVKGDHEAMYWNCEVHDPSHRRPPVFVEQMGSYDPFTTGGRFHG